jgi:hypothetical protein
MNSPTNNSVSVFSKLDVKSSISIIAIQPVVDNNLSFNNTIKKPNMIVPL